MTKAERFAKLNGIEKLCNLERCPRVENKCDVCTLPVKFRFTDAKSILEVMMKREDWDSFLSWIDWYPQDGQDDDQWIKDYILNPDKLLDEAIRWCGKGEVK
jgi:hypothetical protein